MVSCKGAVRPDQLDRYLDEFTFRFNQRSSRSRGLVRPFYQSHYLKNATLEVIVRTE